MRRLSCLPVMIALVLLFAPPAVAQTQTDDTSTGATTTTSGTDTGGTDTTGDDDSTTDDGSTTDDDSTTTDDDSTTGDDSSTTGDDSSTTGDDSTTTTDDDSTTTTDDSTSTDTGDGDDDGDGTSAGNGGDDGGTASTPEPPPIPPVRPAQPVVEISKAAVLGGPLSWLYDELKGVLAGQGIQIDDQGHQVNLDPSVQIIGGYTVDDFPTEWYEIMADIAAQAGCTDPNRPPEQRDSRCSSMLIAPPGGGGTLTAAETARAGAEQAAADAASAAQGGDGSSDDGPSSTSTGRPDDAPGGPSDSDGSTTPEDDPDLGGNDDGNDSGGTDDGGGNGTDDGGTGATDTGDDAGGNGGGSADERGIVFENTDDAQRARFEEALAFIPVDGVRDGLRVVFQDSQSEGPNTAGQWSQPPPTIQIFPIGHNDPHTMVHELVHEVLEGKLDNGEDRFASVFNSLSEQDKALTTPSRYGAADLSGGPEGFHELAAESFSFYLQNKVTELGQPQVPYRERIPAPVQALWDEMIQELGGLP